VFVGLALAAALGAQGGTPSPLACANATPIPYDPPERLALGPPAPQQQLNVFLPVGTPPAQGWPVVVVSIYGGGEATTPRSRYWDSGTTQRFWQLVDSGLAVVEFGTTGAGGGDGLWYPRGHPSGRYESFHPSDDNPEKEAEWAIQWVKTQTLYPLDPARVGTWGRSGGAVILLRAAMGPDGARTSGSEQVRASTRVRAVAALQPPTSVWAFHQGDLGISLPEHLERADAPGVAATALEQVEESLQKAYSLMGACFDGAEERASNEAQAVCLVYGDPITLVDGEPIDLSLDAAGFPVLHDVFVPPAQHDQWFGQALWRRLVGLSGAAAAFHAKHSIFAVRDVYALPAPHDVHTDVFAGSFVGPAATALVHDWLVRELAPEPPDPGGGGTPGEVRSFTKITRGSAGGPPLWVRDQYAAAVSSLGDLDGDGRDELAVGAVFDDDGGGSPGANLGAVWIHFLDAAGTPVAHQKISRTGGGFGGDLGPGDNFGRAVEGLGDLDGDGVPDLAVGAPLDDDGGANQGALWILFLNADGSVKGHAKISETQGGFPAGLLDPGDQLGRAIARVGDLDGDGTADLAVGAPLDRDGGVGRGAVYVLFLHPDGSVASVRKISSTQGGLSSPLANNAHFGFALAGLGDRDGDGTLELAVGAPDQVVAGQRLGVVDVLSLRPDGTVASAVRISEGLGGFDGDLDPGDDFGASLAALGDLDGDGWGDLAVGASYDDDGAAGSPVDRGAVWILLLSQDASVAGSQKVSETQGGLTATLGDTDRFGTSVARTSDRNADGVPDLCVGASFDDEGGPNCGALYVLHLDDGTLPANPAHPSASAGGPLADAPGEPAVRPYGCLEDADGSLVVLDGEPRLGATLVLGVDDPLGVARAGARPVVLLSSAPAPAYPCGTPLDGEPFGPSGEALVSLARPAPFRVLAGAPWSGPGSPAAVLLRIPELPELVGRTLYAQGLLVAPGSVAATAPSRWTRGLEIVIGPREGTR